VLNDSQIVAGISPPNNQFVDNKKTFQQFRKAFLIPLGLELCTQRFARRWNRKTNWHLTGAGAGDLTMWRRLLLFFTIKIRPLTDVVQLPAENNWLHRAALIIFAI